jgi:predicted short-subunit dehydrogenase-like oxidoreductase (DUF2520 family)
MPRALDDITFSLVGAGPVAASLGRWLTAAGARAAAVGVRAGAAPAGERGRALAAALGARAVAVDRLASDGQGLLLVAVADAALDEVAGVLAARPQAAVALHTSGSRGAGALAPLRSGGSAVGSLHPLKAFPAPLPEPAAARGVFFAVDGDAAAQALARRLAAAWGAEAGEVPAERRTLYHFAATLAAGGVTTLLAAAEGLAATLGLPAATARGYRELARGALAAAETASDATAAITGPAVRGDRATLERHLAALAEAAPELVPLAVLLARESLRQLARRAPLDPPRQALAAALEARAEAPGFLDPPGAGC